MFYAGYSIVGYSVSSIISDKCFITRFAINFIYVIAVFYAFLYDIAIFNNKFRAKNKYVVL